MGDLTGIRAIYNIITLLTTSCLEHFPAITKSRKTIRDLLAWPSRAQNWCSGLVGWIRTALFSFYVLYFPNLITGGDFLCYSLCWFYDHLISSVVWVSAPTLNLSLNIWERWSGSREGARSLPIYRKTHEEHFLQFCSIGELWLCFGLRGQKNIKGFHVYLAQYR